MRFDRLKIISGNANRQLAAEIADRLFIELSDARVSTFADGESYIQIRENVRGSDVFVIQSTCGPVNHHVMELLLIIDALKRSSADRITAVLPYFGYARQDRKDRPRVPISARLVASLVERAGAHRVLALDLHAAQIQGFFDIPVDHLFSTPVMLEYFRNMNMEDVTVVSPDAGGVEREQHVARDQAPLLATAEFQLHPAVEHHGDAANAGGVPVDEALLRRLAVHPALGAEHAGAEAMTSMRRIWSWSMRSMFHLSRVLALRVAPSDPLRPRCRRFVRLTLDRDRRKFSHQCPHRIVRTR